MHASAQMKKAALEATRQELDALCARGVRMEGNAFSPIVLIKGDLNEEERAGGALWAARTELRCAHRARLSAMLPRIFAALAAVAGEGDDPALTLGATLPAEVFREALEALDPEAVLLLDATAADLMRETYADALVAIDDFDTAMLKPGLVAHVLGRRVLALDGFEAALGDKREKQRMWAYIKQIGPASAPY